MERSENHDPRLNLKVVGHAIDAAALTRPLVLVFVIAGLASLFDAADAYLLGFAMPGIAKEFALEPQAMGLIASSTLIGMTVGSFAWGWIADKWGRKIAFTLTILMFSLFSGTSGVAFSVGFLLGARFLTGLGIGGSVPVAASILIEFAPARVRGYAAGALPITWPVATFIASGLALLIIPMWGWRGLFLVGALPALLVFWARRGVPESPRWLINRGRFAECRKALAYIGITEEALDRSHAAVMNEPPPPVLPRPRVIDLFTPEMRRRTAHSWIIWGLASLTSWVMNLWLTTLFIKLHGIDITQAVTYVFYISFMAIAGRFTTFFLLEKVGRKPFIVVGYTATGLVIYYLITIHNDALHFAYAVPAYYYFVEMGICAMTVYAPEVYPLHIRALGTSCAMGVGRITGAIGPYIAGLFVGAGHVEWLWIILGSGCVFAGLSTIWLGIETRGQNLEQLNKEGAEGAARVRSQGASTSAPSAAVR